MCNCGGGRSGCTSALGKFGRSKYFVIVDPDTMVFEAVPNKNIIDETGASFLYRTS